MKTIKKYFGIALMAMCVMMLSYSCSSDDDDNVVNNPTVSQQDFLQGKWLGENGGIYLYMAFSGSNITAVIYTATQKNNPLYGTFYFDQANSVINVKWSNGNQETFPVTIASTNSSYFLLSVGKKVYTMRRQSNDFNVNQGDTTSGTDYAPQKLKNCLVKINGYPIYYNLYFDSYGDITKSSRSYAGDIQGGTYYKTEKNKGKVSITIKMGSQTYNHSYIMTFTSSKAGTIKIDNIDGTFTIEDYDNDISAHTNLLGLSFMIGSEGFYFKDYSNGLYICEGIKQVLSYYSIKAKYSRYSDTSARITIISRLDKKYGDERTVFYDLTFTSSTGGTYIRTDNNAFSAGTAKGKFTLK